ncbi:sugar phosphate isomerase/epimerase family protein [Dyadobacter fermentans]|uniref:Xylose isomerase domain protein TIM barrel n=1 Tax=Dyadobacter fermentans (strain ATCC 700827 / DSM 18053 / CIP 107007 / KCTC 52180 / NS114) TaxID=471854 RepID=C6W3P1_DYAFD|nr:sugar phosphate isomerase/epimerase [Dyadobacter fermentans]ACT95739.1 Xylose isomerase domain protein TIM barrel [Dyadobacter fermentans DSM 18053]
MKFGINTYLFSSPFTNESTSIFPQFKSWGFDFVEIALEDPAHIDPHTVRKALDDNGLECRSVCAATGPGRDLRGTRKDQVTAIEYVEALIRIAPVLGSKLVAGPIYSAVGRAELVPEDQKRKQWELVAGNLKALADFAAKHDVKIAIEPLNRYETDFINTCDQALRMIDNVGSDALQVHLDTFHMNLEEKDPAQAIRKAGHRLGLLHASGSDRGTPGNDQINWDRIFAALDAIHYPGDIVIESFTPDVKVIAKAASIWRQVEPSREAIAVDGLHFLRSLAF